MSINEEAGVAETARAFVAAREAARPLPAYPGAEPANMAAAYAIQDAAMRMRGGTIAGWKVGRIMSPHDQHFGANRLAGPIFADQIVQAAAGAPVMPVFADSFGAVEAEFMLRLGPVDPAKRAYSLAEAWDVVAAVHVGIEVASSPFAQINDRGPAVTASDFGNHNGLVIGPAVQGWRTRAIGDWRVTTAIDGIEVGAGTDAAMPDGLAGAVRFLLELLVERGIAPAAGCWISSGAVSGVHPIAPGQRAVARFGDDYQVTCAIAAAEPHA